MQDKEKFVSHMTSGVQLMVKPAEEAILAKTQEILDSQVSYTYVFYLALILCSYVTTM